MEGATRSLGAMERAIERADVGAMEGADVGAKVEVAQLDENTASYESENTEGADLGAIERADLGATEGAMEGATSKEELDSKYSRDTPLGTSLDPSIEPESGDISVSFPKFPGKDVIARLKAAGFTFDGKSWVAPYSEERAALKFALPRQDTARSRTERPTEYARPEPPAQEVAGVVPETAPDLEPVKASFKTRKPRTYESWIKSVGLTHADDGAVCIWSPLAYIDRHLRDDWADELRQVVAEVLGRDCELRFELAEKAES